MIAEVQRLMEPVPSWVTMWYPNDTHSQNLAIARYRTPVCTEAERAAAKAYVREPTFGCDVCGKFAFAEPTKCYWCGRGFR